MIFKIKLLKNTKKTPRKIQLNNPRNALNTTARNNNRWATESFIRKISDFYLQVRKNFGKLSEMTKVQLEGVG